ncbi:MAG TPA: nicotinate-nucleotide adenylyltransferase [Chloroflexota bacterium]
MSERVGVFGGTFDPIHIGHLAAAQDAADALDLTRVLFVPNRRPPHKVGLVVSPAKDRLAMVELSIAGNPRFQLSTIEFERDGLSYTLDTLRELRRHNSGTELIFLTGCDALSQLHTWSRPRELLDEFQIAIMDRPTGKQVSWEAVEERFPAIRHQVEIVHVVQLNISSDEIRRRVTTGHSIKYYVVPAVEEYIVEHGLYVE